MTSHRPIEGRSSERGIALISALLIVMLVTVVAAAFIFMSSGERAVSSNVQVSRASLLAADAGVRVAQQVLANDAKAQLDNLVLNWGGAGPIITSPSTMFPTAPQTFTSTSPSFTATATIVFADQNLGADAQSYNFRYTITSTGSSGAQGLRQVQSTGILRVSAERGSFADYLLFTDVHAGPNGEQVWFNSSTQFDGRVHTNGQFRFAFQPLFQDLVSSVSTQAWFWNGGAPLELAGDSNGNLDVPLFYGGFKRGESAIGLPTNAFDQQTASLGLTPNGAPPSDVQINEQLGRGSVAGPPPNDIYLVTNPVGGDPGTVGVVNGGLYVQGNLSQYAMVADTLNNLQIYTLTQGGLTKTITVDYTANRTTLQIGAASSIYTGVPRGSSFINGNLSDLRGPDRVSGTVPPAVATGTKMLVTATGDIVIQRDLICEDYTAAANVLGIYSSTGSVRVGSSAPVDMNLDAFVMANGASGSFLVDSFDSGSPRGVFHLRGGVVQRYFGPFFTLDGNGNVDHGFWRDFHYDRRGLIPPYFPTTNRFFANQPTARTLAWKEI